jgi:hypothetical protein
LRRTVMLGGRVFGWMGIRLPFWSRCRHANIVAPESGGVPAKTFGVAGYFQGTVVTNPAYQRLMAEWTCVRSASGEDL